MQQLLHTFFSSAQRKPMVKMMLIATQSKRFLRMKITRTNRRRKRSQRSTTLKCMVIRRMKINRGKTRGMNQPLKMQPHPQSPKIQSHVPSPNQIPRWAIHQKWIPRVPCRPWRLSSLHPGHQHWPLLIQVPWQISFFRLSLHWDNYITTLQLCCTCWCSTIRLVASPQLPLRAQTWSWAAARSCAQEIGGATWKNTFAHLVIFKNHLWLCVNICHW